MRKKILIILLIIYISFVRSDYSDSYESEKRTTVSSNHNSTSDISKGYFTVTANRLLRLNKPYKVSIQYNGYENETVLSIGIKNRSFEEYQNVTLIGSDSKTIKFIVSENSKFNFNFFLQFSSHESQEFKLIMHHI